MCVIIIKDYDQAIPSDAILEACYHGNPHGLGVSIHKPNSPKIDNRKGFMTLTAMRELLIDLRANHSDSFIAFHFRFTTSGSTSKGNCHPFPLIESSKNSLSTELLKLERFSSDSCFMHNGVLGSGDTILDLSDTQLFVRDVLPSLLVYQKQNKTGKQDKTCKQDIDVQKTTATLEEYAGLSGSRFIFMSTTKDNDLSLVFAGSWLLHEGYVVSNTNFVHNLSRSYSRRDSLNSLNSFGRYDYNDYNDYNGQLCAFCSGEMMNTNLADVLICCDCGMLDYKIDIDTDIDIDIDKYSY